jgi:hypothetical protein
VSRVPTPSRLQLFAPSSRLPELEPSCGVAYASLAINGAGGNRPRYLPGAGGLGPLRRVWRETAEADANHETLIRELLDDQYSHPRRIVAFNTAEGWSRDVTVDIADELRRRFAEYDDVPVSVEEFLEMARR